MIRGCFLVILEGRRGVKIGAFVAFGCLERVWFWSLGESLFKMNILFISHSDFGEIDGRSKPICEALGILRRIGH